MKQPTSQPSKLEDLDDQALQEASLELVDLQQDPLLAPSTIARHHGPIDPHFFKPAVTSSGSEAREAAHRSMTQAWGILQKLGRDLDWIPMEEDPDAWREALVADLPDPDKFMAGRLGERVDILEEFFRISGNQTKAAQQVIRWLKHGIYSKFVPVDNPGQEDMPFFRKKKEIVTKMLKQALPEGTAIEGYLKGDRPKEVHFPNHNSTTVYADFVKEELEGMLRKKVVKEWAWSEDPVVINGLRVVDEKWPKLRLCLNPMYVNLFLQYSPLKYERLGDLPNLAEDGDFAFTTDDKSGYWQCPLHPAMWKYLAFQVEGKVYCWTHLPFGVAPACRIYTAIKQEIYRPLREAGLRMVFLIDDQMSLQKGKERTRAQCGAMCRLLAALGWTLSVSKCQLEPARTAKFLGLIVDLAQRSFRVPEDKRQALMALVGELSSAKIVSDRRIACLAGKVMALSPALDLAPLLARGMMKAMQGQQKWDELYATPASFKADMSLLLDLMEARAEGGRSWSLSSTVIQAVGDASETALAAFFPNGELDGRIVIPFTQAQREAVAAHQWSSTARELSVLPKLLATIEEQRPGLLRGARLQYATDSQPAMVDLMRMKGNENTFPLVREVRLLAARMGADLDVIWRPREHKLQQQADDDSKVVDKGDWSLHPEVFQLVCTHPVLGGRMITVDLFASPTNSVAPTFFSLFWGPGCKGVDAFAQSWASTVGRAHNGLAFVNGPFNQMDAILRKLLVERVDAIVISPDWPRPWAALWAQLPVRARMRLPHREDLFVPGSLVPANQRRPKAPRYRVWAYYVLW